MEMLLKFWQEKQPQTYNLNILKTVLSAEVSLWLELMKTKLTFIYLGLKWYDNVAEYYHYEQVWEKTISSELTHILPVQDSVPVEQVFVQSHLGLLLLAVLLCRVRLLAASLSLLHPPELGSVALHLLLPHHPAVQPQDLLLPRPALPVPFPGLARHPHHTRQVRGPRGVQHAVPSRPHQAQRPAPAQEQ